MFTNSSCRRNIIHEAIHIKNVIFDIIHYQVDCNNDEAEAYLVQYLYESLIKVFNTHTQNSKE